MRKAFVLDGRVGTRRSCSYHSCHKSTPQDPLLTLLCFFGFIQSTMMVGFLASHDFLLYFSRVSSFPSSIEKPSQIRTLVCYNESSGWMLLLTVGKACETVVFLVVGCRGKGSAMLASLKVLSFWTQHICSILPKCDGRL